MMLPAVVDALLDAGIAGGRVHPVRLPQGAVMPSVCVNTVSFTPLYASEGEVGLSGGRVQVDCFAATYAAANTVARAVQTALSGSAESPFANVMLDNEQSLTENDPPYLFRIIQDYTILMTP